MGRRVIDSCNEAILARLDHQVIKIDLVTLGENKLEEGEWTAAIRHFLARLYHFVEFSVL